jgi:hypothetical protein
MERGEFSITASIVPAVVTIPELPFSTASNCEFFRRPFYPPNHPSTKIIDNICHPFIKTPVEYRSALLGG